MGNCRGKLSRIATFSSDGLCWADWLFLRRCLLQEMPGNSKSTSVVVGRRHWSNILELERKRCILISSWLACRDNGDAHCSMVTLTKRALPGSCGRGVGVSISILQDSVRSLAQGNIKECRFAVVAEQAPDGLLNGGTLSHTMSQPSRMNWWSDSQEHVQIGEIPSSVLKSAVISVNFRESLHIN